MCVGAVCRFTLRRTTGPAPSTLGTGIAVGRLGPRAHTRSGELASVAGPPGRGQTGGPCASIKFLRAVGPALTRPGGRALTLPSGPAHRSRPRAGAARKNPPCRCRYRSPQHRTADSDWGPSAARLSHHRPDSDRHRCHGPGARRFKSSTPPPSGRPGRPARSGLIVASPARVVSVFHSYNPIYN